jgi:cbb3-type cytochrome oxidase subunit 3
MIQTASDQAFFLIVISICLGACLVWAFWNIEEARQRHQQRRELVRAARRAMSSSR